MPDVDRRFLRVRILQVSRVARREGPTPRLCNARTHACTHFAATLTGVGAQGSINIPSSLRRTLSKKARRAEMQRIGTQTSPLLVVSVEGIDALTAIVKAAKLPIA